MNSPGQKTEPDPDAIKMFVGQIPRAWDENELKKMFEEYGPIHQLNVLRDKVTGQSKGCCFLTYYTRKSALDAQNDLHNIKTLPGMHHPVQMKPADSEKRNIEAVEERKLFVGMISKKLNENDVRMMFAPFGTIEDCTVLRDQNGQSRGCAFVTYANRQSAQNCIKSMHHSQTMENCSSPIVVKFADTQKEKEQKKLQQMNANLWNASFGGLGAMGPQYLALLQQAAAAQGGNMNIFSGLSNLGDASNNMNFQNLQTLAALANATSNPNAVNGLGLQSLSSLTGVTTSPNPSGPLSGSLSASSNSLSGLASLQSMGSNNLGASSPGVSTSMNGISSGTPTGMDALSQAYTGIQQYQGLSGLLSPASFPNAFNSQTAQQIQQAAANSPAGKQTEGLDRYLYHMRPQQEYGDHMGPDRVKGPEGANLFIYHLPQEFSDQDLCSTFAPFGNVISAKVFIDKQTNLSKCFGFVSYDNPVSAQAAIQAMNGFQIGMKRLKVQLKRPKNDSKPY